MPGNRIDPYRAYDFKLDINGITEGHFTECVGMGVDVETIEYREAGQGQLVRQLPGQVNYQDITLKFGLTSSAAIWDWFMLVVEGKVERKNVSIIQMGPDHATEVMRWDLEQAWPKSWKAPSYNALSNEAAIETITLTYEFLSRK